MSLMDWPIELEVERVGERFGRETAWRKGEEVVVPVLDALHLLQILRCVVLGDDLRADRIEPRVSVGVVEVPVRVDKMGDGLGAEVGERLRHLRA